MLEPSVYRSQDRFVRQQLLRLRARDCTGAALRQPLLDYKNFVSQREHGVPAVDK